MTTDSTPPFRKWPISRVYGQTDAGRYDRNDYSRIENQNYYSRMKKAAPDGAASCDS